MQPNALPSPSRRAQAGFSLLEMLVSISILSAVAYVALDAAEMNTGQIRYDKTERRLEIIRKAIVGDPNRTANGTPVISGFVADMGTLPGCIEALRVRETDCGDSDAAEPVEFVSSFLGLSYGWRGPYITAASSGFADAWGNNSDGDVNHGWVFTPDTTNGSLEIASNGRNRAAGPATAADTNEQYDLDFQMAPISDRDYSVELDTTAITLELQPGSSVTQVCVAFVVPRLRDPDELDDNRDWALIVHSYDPTPADTSTSIAPRPILFTPGIDQEITFYSAERMPFGVRSLIFYDPGHAEVNNNDCQATNTENDLELAFLDPDDSPLLGASHSILFLPRVNPTVDLTIDLEGS